MLNILRISASIVATYVAYFLVTLYGATMPSIEAKVAVGQVNDSVVEYSLIQTFMQSHMGKPLIYGIFAAIILLIWWKPLKAFFSIETNNE